ncbi:hypothetical protein AB0M28_27050 [Streptomyces sp. NPDC051940]|uniref:Zn-ribbon domain-containing OB-fold protein n=1 Tax=Streptomyces sp. NPDC051940 TaxID=3155675 RepID=UPI0034124AF9
MYPPAHRDGPDSPARRSRPATTAELHLQRCRWCGNAVVGSCLLCPSCGSTDLLQELSGGLGTIRRHVPVPRRGTQPRLLAVVELREGARLKSRVDGVLPEMAPVGTQVRFVGYDRTGQLVPVFRVNFSAGPRTWPLPVRGDSRVQDPAAAGRWGWPTRPLGLAEDGSRGPAHAAPGSQAEA